MNLKMRFCAHESFFIRKGWLFKGMKNIQQKPDLFTNKEIASTDILGMGNNMVKSLRYWLQVVGVAEEVKSKKRVQKFTGLGEIIFKNDCYIEELGTLWLLHYCLASNQEQATSWYYFFNEFNMQEFTKEDFCDAIKNYISIHSEELVADSSIERDFDCLMNTYISRIKSNPQKVHPENNIDCPLGELNLVDVKERKTKTYMKVIPPKSMIHPMIALAVIIDQANIKDLNEIKISSILKDDNNIGKLFNLDMITLLDILYRIEKLGYISVIRTAGLDIIKIQKKLTFLECVQVYYQDINNL